MDNTDLSVTNNDKIVAYLVILLRTILKAIGIIGLIIISAQSVFASCEALTREGQDTISQQSDNVIIVGQDFDTILDRGILSFALYEDFAPYSYKENGEFKGIDVEIAKVIAQELGVKPKFNLYRADENVDADFRNQIWKGPLINGQVSNIMMHAPYNRDLQCRNEFVVLGAQYMNETLATAYRKSIFEDGAPTPPYYRFHKVGVEDHTISAFYLENFGGGILLSSIKHYPSHEAAFTAMQNDEVDAVMGVKGILEHLVQTDETDEIAVDTPPLINFALKDWTLGIAVNFRYRKLYYSAETVINAMIKDGRMKTIFESYGIEWISPALETN